MAIESVAEQDECAFDALLTREQVGQLEDTARSFDPARRVAAITLTRSKAQLLDDIDVDAAKALLLIHEQISSYIEHLDSMREMATTALARTLVVMDDALRLHPELDGVELDA